MLIVILNFKISIAIGSFLFFIGCENGGVGEFCCTNGADNQDCTFPTEPPKEYLPPSNTYLPA
jgi:hypothetical protein